MNGDYKNLWENFKEGVKEFRDSLSQVFYVLFFILCIIIGVWSFGEALMPADVWEDVIKPIGGIIFWTITALVIFSIKSWWDKRQDKKTMDKIIADLHSRKDTENKNTKNNA